MESQFRQVVNRSAENLNHPPNVEEEHRKNAYPDICSEKCTFITCPYRRAENYGKMCEKKWQQYRTESQNMSNPLASIPNIKTQIDQIVKRAFEPFNARLAKIETAKIERTFEFNGKRMHLPDALNTQGYLRVDQNKNRN